MKKTVLGVVFAFALLAGAGFGTIAIFSTDVSAGAVNIDTRGVALSGYDPVAYLADGAPKEGKREHMVRMNGAIYHFASADNKELFQNNPEKYLPRFGGFCAYGVRMGQRFQIDPTAFTVVDGRTYLFLDPATMMTWKEDQAQNITIAEQIWPTLAGNA